VRDGHSLVGKIDDTVQILSEIITVLAWFEKRHIDISALSERHDICGGSELAAIPGLR
jgi:hypothetical protein